jgi:adhesin transport system outer membrane protein
MLQTGSRRFLILLYAWMPLLLQAQTLELVFDSAVVPISLQKLIVDVIQKHPQITVQNAAVHVAEAGVQGAQWQFYPTPSITMESANVSAGDTSYGGDRHVSVLGLRQTLWNGGRLTASLDKAKAAVTLSSAIREESKQQLALRVIQSYGDWIAAFEKQKVYLSGLSLHRQMKEMVVRRVQEGLSAHSDQILAEERLALLEADALASASQKRTALLKLSQLAGLSVNELSLAQAPTSTRLNDSPLATLLQLVDSHSPTLARYRAVARMQLSAVIERKADVWPEIYARVERQYGNFSIAGLQTVNRAFVGVATRFGAGLSTQTAIAEAMGQHEAALAEIEVQRLSLQEQVMVDHTMLMDSETRRIALKEGAAKSRQVLQSWDRQFFSGRKSWQDLMNSAREQIQMEVQIADLEAARLIASWRLFALTEPELLMGSL